MDRIIITTPDDWHLHVRDGAALRAVAPHTAAQFARAIIMPNLKPPIVNTDLAQAYRDRVMAALPAASKFQPLMTLYLTDNTPAKEIQRTRDGLVFHGPRGGIIKPDTTRNILIRDVITPLAAQFPAPEGEIGFADGRLHSFRHFFCSVCANTGVPEQVVMRWLGHQSSRMVRHYYHLHDEEAQRQMERVQFLSPTGTCDAG